MGRPVDDNIVLRPIGIVVEGLPRLEEGSRPLSRLVVESVIRVYEEYSGGLEGLSEYSHAIVLYWMHEVRGYRLKVKPWGREDLPWVGVFATRSPHRPNPIGLTVVELVEVRPPFLRVRGLDAWPGSPILDLKPYDYYDVVKKPRVPAWFRDKWEERRSIYSDIAPWLGPCDC